MTDIPVTVLGFSKSDTIEKLAEALSIAQGQMTNATKNSTNPHFKSKYADLAAVIDCSKEALAKNGLSVVQIPNGKPPFVSVTTILLHKTGQYITGEITLKSRSDSPQDMGSAITYAKRYALSAMLNIAADDDDDGNAATQNNRYDQRPKPATQNHNPPPPVDEIYDESKPEHKQALGQAFKKVFPDAEFPKEALMKLSKQLTGRSALKHLAMEIDTYFNEPPQEA